MEATVQGVEVAIGVVCSEQVFFNVTIETQLVGEGRVFGVDPVSECVARNGLELCPICACCARIVPCWSPFRTTRDHLIGNQETAVALVGRGLW